MAWKLPFSSHALKKYMDLGAPAVCQWVKKPTNIDEDVGSIPGLTHWVWDPVLPQAAV